LLLTAAHGVAASAQSRPMRAVCLVETQSPSPVEQTIVTMLQQELARRSAVHWGCDDSVPATLRVVLTRASQLPGLLDGAERARWKAAWPGTGTLPAESYRVLPIAPAAGDASTTVVLAGADERGELFAVGWLLRHLDYAQDTVTLLARGAVQVVPEKPIRGYQIGYRPKNNTYDAWTMAQFEQQLRDLAIFGMNTVQAIAPVSDDASVSPLYHAPPLQVVIGLSKLCAQYGLRFDLYYPEMRADYRDPQQRAAELADFEALVRQLPRIDGLHVPGGDPGHTPPEVLLPLVAQQAAILRRYQPHAQVWVSAQGFDAASFERFYALLAQQPSWLTGVFFGPQSRDSMETERRRIPQRYPLEFYPDTAHTMHAQFPVPQWDPIFQLTEGREPICPRPAAFTHIYRHFAALNSGFIVYAEGVNDDVNKVLWAQLGWSSQAEPHAVLTEYARTLLGAEGAHASQAASAIAALEQNWVGPVVASRTIASTLDQIDSLTPVVTQNWRWNSLVYRAVYDDYVRRKRIRMAAEQRAAELALACPAGDSERCAARARAALQALPPDAVEQSEHDRLFQLAGRLFDQVGLQLSVKLYHASGWERGANLDRVDMPLNDAVWMRQAMDDALAQPDEAARLAALRAITDWRRPSAGAIYDDLGSPNEEPHLVRGEGWSRDPELYRTANDGVADESLDAPWRLSWLSYAEALYEVPLRMRYEHLDPRRHYRLRITYAGEGYALPLTLTANGQVVQTGFVRRSNPQIVTLDLPAELTAKGTLTLDWERPAGLGGSGRGRQIAEVWLLPQTAPSTSKR
jgi:hypothetical protein